MKKLIFIQFILISLNGFSQEKEEEELYNRWSVEFNIGQNKPIRPFSSGYYSSDATQYFNINGIEHFDIGVRYMFSPVFGLKLDIAQDIVKNNDTISLPFKNIQYRFGFQGVANLGRLMRFESFTDRFGLLAHGGLQVSQHIPKMGINTNVSEDNGGIIFGLTPQYRIRKNMAITTDFSIINNLRQHLNWDGNPSAADNNLTGLLYNISFGLTLYLGKLEKHADWYTSKDSLEKAPTVDKESRKRLDEIETLMNDTDRDGVPDYLDVQNNTPNGLVVDTKGRFIDSNNNGVADELEKDSQVNDDSNKNTIAKLPDSKDMVEEGYVNIFFATNSNKPNQASVNDLFILLKYLRYNPLYKVQLMGYADLKGDEKSNLELSKRRAESVYRLLIANGITADRITIEGLGIDTNFYGDSNLSLDLSRRVSIKITK